MFNPNPRRPLTRRQTARIVIATAILAWATQTLLQQWGYGAEVGSQAGSARLMTFAVVQNQTVERFIPPTHSRPARLELRPEATVIGADVTLKQIARWSELDAPMFAPVAELTLGQLGQSLPFRSIPMDEVKSTLRDAGVNLASIHFVGATTCVVSRADVQVDETQALDQWIDARRGNSSGAPAAAESDPTTAPTNNLVALATEANLSAPACVDATGMEDQTTNNLRNVLIRDLCARLGLQRDQLQITFKSGVEKTLNLAEPQFKFEIEPVRVRNLGDVAWNVTIISGDSRQRVSVVADARAWQHQLVADKAIAFKQVVREDDLIERRTLVDRLPETPCLMKDQAVGQQASRDIKSGTLLTAKLIDPVPLVRAGQFVTVTLSQGNIQIKTVARALEGGAYGQTIRVKNETTRDVFQVIITGPQTASVSAPQLSSVQGR